MGSKSARASKKAAINSTPSTTIAKKDGVSKKKQAAEIFAETGQIARYDGKNGVFYVNKAAKSKSTVTVSESTGVVEVTEGNVFPSETDQVYGS